MYKPRSNHVPSGLLRVRHAGFTLALGGVADWGRWSLANARRGHKPCQPPAEGWGDRRAPLGITLCLEVLVGPAKRGECFELLHHVRVFQIFAAAEER